jgi:hypothetical protein
VIVADEFPKPYWLVFISPAYMVTERLMPEPLLFLSPLQARELEAKILTLKIAFSY